jgi:hypothetical protein
MMMCSLVDVYTFQECGGSIFGIREHIIQATSGNACNLIGLLSDPEDGGK